MSTLICGIDEAGRGPLAGPVTASAVVLGTDFPTDELADSKTIPQPKREILTKLILSAAFDYAVGWVWPEEIDRYNIHNASLLAMKRAFEGLHCLPEEVLVDGLYVPEIPVPGRAVVDGDALHHEIMAASILAKTARDRWMIRYSWLEPRYGFERHKGYGTAEHRELCRIHGLCPIHRKSFRIELDLHPTLPFDGSDPAAVSSTGTSRGSTE
jgi:ribonuclease HII